MTEPRQQLTPDLVGLAIQHGMLDDSLDALRDIIARRKELLAKEKAHSLLPGETFLATNISPKKLNGVTFRFIEWDGGWLRCEFHNQWERPSNYSRIIKLRESHVGTILGRS